MSKFSFVDARDVALSSFRYHRFSNFLATPDVIATLLDLAQNSQRCEGSVQEEEDRIEEGKS